jgi:hypothetical protein
MFIFRKIFRKSKSILANSVRIIYTSHKKLAINKDVRKLFNESVTPNVSLSFSKELYFVSKWISEHKLEIKRETERFQEELKSIPATIPYVSTCPHTL